MSQRADPGISSKLMPDGFVGLDVHSDSGDGVEYRSRLFIAARDIREVVAAIPEVQANERGTVVQLSDATLEISIRGSDWEPLLALEIHREPHLPYGGYDTWACSFTNAKEVVDSLKSVLESLP